MTSTALKLLALVLMLLDHIAEFIPGMPIWLHWLGRISAPLFMFCMVWGYSYTHDRKRYLLRLYLFGVFMAVSNFICNLVISEPYYYIINNVFVTWFITGVIISLIECTKKDKKKGAKYWLIFIASQLAITMICALGQALLPFPNMAMTIGAILPSFLFNEGSFLFTLLGVLLYFNRHTKKDVALSYGIFCIVYFLVCLLNGFSYENLFLLNYQWMMIFSLPFMLLYNGKKGKGYKYLFYVFYPAHIILLYFMGNLLF